MTTAQNTQDHEVIRNWAIARNGRPSTTEGGEVLRIDFDEPEDGLTEVSWDEFFRIFDQKGLAFVYQAMTESGDESHVCKFVLADQEISFPKE